MVMQGKDRGKSSGCRVIYVVHEVMHESFLCLFYLCRGQLKLQFGGRPRGPP
jgi:hypothetical protein